MMLAKIDDTENDLRHYVLMTEPSVEFKVEKRLADMDFNPFVPKEKRQEVRTRHSMFGTHRYKVDVIRPVFRGYIFVPLNMAWSFGPFYSVPGLRSRPFLMTCGEPAILKAVDVKRLKGLDGALQEPTSHGQPYKIGDQVRVLNGVFRDFVAKVQKLDDRGRIELLMDILGGNAKAELHVSQVAPG
jgi:transcription antitermination factor NusG